MTEPTKTITDGVLRYGGNRVHTHDLDAHRQNRPKPVDQLARHIADWFDDVYGETTATPFETEQGLARFLHDLGYRQVQS